MACPPPNPFLLHPLLRGRAVLCRSVPCRADTDCGRYANGRAALKTVTTIAHAAIAMLAVYLLMLDVAAAGFCAIASALAFDAMARTLR